MAVVCLRSKFGFCKFDRNCVNIHYTDVCNDTHCRGRQCEKRHPVVCSFFRNYGRCKFGNYCAYRHPLSREQKLDIEVNTLKSELNDVKQKLEILTAKIENLEKTDKTSESVAEEQENVIITSEKTEEVQQESQRKTSSKVKVPEQKETQSTETTLEDIIRENSFKYQCDQKGDDGVKCSYTTRIKKQMKIHHKEYFECKICLWRTRTIHEEKKLEDHMKKEHDILELCPFSGPYDILIDQN